jgi:hypothetical protein
MNPLSEKIRNLLINAPKGVHSIFYGDKIKNGEKTGEKAIIYHVDEKLPLDQIPKEELLPSIITIDADNHPTDVIQNTRFKTNQCLSLNDQSIKNLNSRVRPLSGGLMISALASWSEPSPNSFNFEVGTLGFIAVDNTDNTLVGVTNNHVIINDATLTSERNASSTVQNINDPIIFNISGGYNATLNPSVLQFDLTNGHVNFSNDSIGQPKRYVPLSLYNTNTVDGALISLLSGNTDSNSASQAQLSSTYALPFATTSQIDSLMTAGKNLYSVGRTTGAKGVTCPLITVGIHGSFNVEYNKQGSLVNYIISDVIVYQFVDGSNLPIYSGDSGSAVICNYNGVNKIVGLAFAGNTSGEINNNPTSTYGIACRIDNVATSLNISAWNGQPHSFNTNSNISKIYRPNSDTRTSIIYNGKTYYQAGLISTSSPITNV